MLDRLAATLAGQGDDAWRGAAALRLRVRMQPAAGLGARVMPPTYSGSDGPVYLEEERRLEDAAIRCVLLDSQASQSNRLEEALLGMVRSGEVRIPDVVVDQQEFGRHSALEFAHRVTDAYAEDALLDGQRFGETDLYARLASVVNRGVARPLVDHFPVGLLLGLWASRRHNPQGSTRLARAITSEIIGYDFIPGQRAASKVDLHDVSAAVRLVPRGDTSGSRFDVASDPKAKAAQRPSEFGYGNVTPQAAQHGGGTVRFAEQQTVVSLAALRATRYAEHADGGPSDPAVDGVVRELLVLLAVTMLEAQVELGWDLRSGCHLVPEQEPSLEVVGRLGQVLDRVPLAGLDAAARLADRTVSAAERGIRWNVAPTELKASPQQLDLLRRSLGLVAEETPAA